MALLSKSFIHLLNANFISKFVLFSGQLIVASMITPTQLGELKSSLSYIEILSVVCLFGFNTSILYLCNKNVPKHKLTEVLSTSYIFCAFISILFSLLTYLGIDHIEHIDSNIKSIVKSIVWILPLITLTTLASNFLQSQEQFKDIMNATLKPKIITLFLLVVLTYYLSLNGYIIGYYAGGAISFFCIFLYVRSYLSVICFNYTYFVILVRVGYKAMLSNLIGVINLNCGLVALNYHSVDKEIIGQFAVSMMVYLGFEMLIQTYQQYMIPKYSKEKENKKSWLELLKNSEKKLFKYVSLITILSLLVLMPAYFFFDSFVYRDALLILSVMIVIWYLTPLMSLKGAAFISIGRTDINLKVSLITSVFSIPLMFFLIGEYSVYGAAIARLPVILLSTIIFKYYLSTLRKGL